MNAPVVQCPLEPLYAGGHERVLVQNHQVSSQTAHALGAHGVALVRHGGRPDLRRLERLLDFL